MNLIFERVLSNDDSKITEVYEIIKNSGEDMFRNQGLIHWRTPYPIESIRKNCSEREVFLAKDLDKEQYVHTFQLEFIYTSIENKIDENVAIINKFATDPHIAGRGIGKQSMDFIEDYCRSKDTSKLCLDVYEKSEHAIKFYKDRGFSIIGEKTTRHFVVYLMEKNIQK
jgi:GNAT superfamily N-acetyltransferase